MQSKEGLLAIAEGGTVFLDEVGELPVDLQAKMLRALQEKEIRPVGSTKLVPINVRILAATNRDLEHAVAQGSFRRDLFFRLNVLSLRIPPLRERRQDIPLLAGHVLERLAHSSGRAHELSDDAMKALLAYDWPGNVRELENCLERCCAMVTGPVIHVPDLPSSLSGAPAQAISRSSEARILPIADWKIRPSLAPLRNSMATSLWRPSFLESARQLSTASSKNTARSCDQVGTAVPDLALADRPTTRLAVYFQHHDLARQLRSLSA
jgi:DNA-binding NtrC family response regulator